MRKHLKLLAAFGLSALTVAAWVLYMRWYNAANHDSYFLTHARPIWEMAPSAVREVWDYILNYWHNKFYYPSTWHFFLGALIAGSLVLPLVRLTPWTHAVLYVLVGSLAFALLFFEQFRDHDYYFITLIPAIAFLTVHSFLLLRQKFPRIFGHWSVKAGLAFLCLLSLNYAREKLDERYRLGGADPFSKVGTLLAGARATLDDLAIPETARFVMLNDPTPNGGLYFIDRRGWSVPDVDARSLHLLENYRAHGATYIILLGKPIPEVMQYVELISEEQGYSIYRFRK